jgi:hypothetical protein
MVGGIQDQAYLSLVYLRLARGQWLLGDLRHQLQNPRFPHATKKLSHPRHDKCTERRKSRRPEKEITATKAKVTPVATGFVASPVTD